MSAKKGLFSIWMAILGIIILIGLFTTYKLFTTGHVLFNTNDVVIWSLPLGVYIYLALASSGLTILAALPLVFGIGKYEPFAKRLVFLAIATLCGAFVSIGLELGNVFHMIYIMFSPNLSSPIWWMGAIYGLELIVLIVKFGLMHKGDWHSGFSKALATASFILALVAPLMIGSVFGITESRVTYFGPVMSIYCLLMAFMSGTALFLFYSLIVNKLNGNGVPTELYDEFALIFTYATAVVVGFTLLKFAIESATVVPEFLAYHQFEHAFGAIRGLHTEVLLGLFLPFVLLLFPAVRKSVGGKIAASALILTGTLFMHMEILLAGQSHPVGPKAEQYPEFINYFPSIWEFLVFLFALGIMLLLYSLGERFLNLTEAPE
ncbi:MAG: polysulfide reductase NrfD [Deltaproteobacteria bacterium]|nr:polysulfide reductase NrfD [Deltaproteobacteria bacterium]